MLLNKLKFLVLILVSSLNLKAMEHRVQEIPTSSLTIKLRNDCTRMKLFWDNDQHPFIVRSDLISGDEITYHNSGYNKIDLPFLSHRLLRYDISADNRGGISGVFNLENHRSANDIILKLNIDEKGGIKSFINKVSLFSKFDNQDK